MDRMRDEFGSLAPLIAVLGCAVAGIIGLSLVGIVSVLVWP